MSFGLVTPFLVLSLKETVPFVCKGRVFLVVVLTPKPEKDRVSNDGGSVRHHVLSTSQALDVN